MFAQAEGDFRTADEFLHKARGLFENHGDRDRAAATLPEFAFGAFSMGEVEQARCHIAQARDEARQIEDDFLLAEVLCVESLVETAAGDYDRGQVTLEEALAIFRRLGAPQRVWLHQLINVGWVALHRHDFPRAREAFEEYLAVDSWKSPIGIANGHGNLGLVAIYEGDRDAADAECRQALAYARAPRAGPTIAESLFGLAAVAAMDGDLGRAVRLWSAAEALKAAMQATLSAPEQFIVDRHLEPAGAGLAEEVRERARREGAAMNLDEAVAYALE